MALAALIGLSAVLGLVTWNIKNVHAGLGILLGVAVLQVVTIGALWCGVPGDGLAPFIDLDAAGLLFVSISSVLFLAASIYTIPYLLDGTHDPQSAPHRFVPCLLWFQSAMTLVAATQHLAVMWAAIEGTTLASAPLVYFYRRRGALEAAWKYLLLCSVGIALALLGTFFLGIAGSAAGGERASLTLSALAEIAPSMSRPWLRGAFVLALVGYGTKMGLAPLHTWLPDTHSQAPSPVSALLSGALLNCAFLAILRFYQVCLASGDFAFARTLLLLFGFVSIGVACAFMVGQRDYKRLFAYSSVENMGIMTVGVGIGGLAGYGAMLHAVNHSLCKAGLFFLAGNVLRAFGTTSAPEVRGLLQRIPATGMLMIALFLALGGVPPFGPFWSEFMIFQSALNGGEPWLGILFVTLLAVAFLGMAGVLLPMLQGTTGPTQQRADEPRLALLAPLVMTGGALMMGVFVPPILVDALRHAADLVKG
jgi:hydrogenase-4 component F